MSAEQLPDDPASLPAGSRLQFVIRVDAPETSVEIPVTVLRGRREGPRLTLIGGIHGDEFDGPRALMSLAQTLSPYALAGTVVIAPVVNIPAFRACNRISPIDGLNLNRIFPGNANGSVTERIASAVIARLVRGSDAVYSMHGATSWSILDPWVEFQCVESPVGLASYRMALAAHFPNMFPLPYGYDPGLLIFACYDLGIPCIEGERGGNGTTTAAQWLAYVDSAKRVMVHLGMLRGILRRGPVPEIHDHVGVAAITDGFWERSVVPGQAVDEGQPLGTLRDLSGAVIDRPVAPFAGKVVSTRTRPPTAADDRLVAIGRPVELSPYFEA